VADAGIGFGGVVGVVLLFLGCCFIALRLLFYCLPMVVLLSSDDYFVTSRFLFFIFLMIILSPFDRCFVIS